MKKLLNCVILFSVLSLNFLYAAIITVDNKHPYAGDYKTLQEAHDAATNGDIIYVSPSLQVYVAITVTKQLFIYGVGFDITEAIGGAYTTPTIISGEMIFNAGSEGSQIEGFDGSFNITVNAPNITIKRNNLFRIMINSQGAGSSIVQNKIIGSYGGYHPTDGMITINTTNIFISNNIIKNTYGSGYPGTDGSTLYGGNNLTIRNNVFQHYDGGPFSSIDNTFIINNIFIQGYLGGTTNCIWNYNMAWTTLPDGIGNVSNIDMNTVFIDYPNEDFHLLPDSPAHGAGENGTDMGIYGGDMPYVDGGFPGLPSILQIQAPTAGSQQSGLDISFKAKSNKE